MVRLAQLDAAGSTEWGRQPSTGFRLETPPAGVSKSTYDSRSCDYAMSLPRSSGKLLLFVSGWPVAVVRPRPV